MTENKNNASGNEQRGVAPAKPAGGTQPSRPVPTGGEKKPPSDD